MNRLHCCALIVGLLTLPPAASRARPPGAAGDRALGVAGDMGFGGMGGKAYATVQSGIDIREGDLSLGLFGRVRILMQDDPSSGAVRGRDWDEASDYVHILRYLRYQRTFHHEALGGPVRLVARAGEILGYTLGHGTLIRDYSNIADPDHPHTGLHLAVGARRWRFESTLDNLVDPSVVALRASARPVSEASALQVGSSLVIDPRAPVAIDVVSEPTPVRRTDGAFNLQGRTAALTLVGLDVEYQLGNDVDGRLTPYLDLNTSMLGLGLHAGASGEVPVGESKLRVFGQLEYQLASEGYAPTHINTFYDVERYQAGLSWSDPSQASVDDRSPMLAGLARGAYGGHGLLAQAGLRLERLLQLKIGVSYRPGPDAVSLWGRATTSPIKRINLGLLVLVRGLGGDYPGAAGLAAMAEGRVRITDTLYGMAQYSRCWSLDASSGYFGIIQSFNLGVGAAWSG